MKQTALLIAVSLLLTACIAMSSYLFVYFDSYAVDYSDLEIKSYAYENGVFTVEVKSDVKGEYLYKVLAREVGDELVLTFRGGKQPSRSYNTGKVTSTFEIQVPAGTSRIVCDGSTVYTID